MDQDVAMVFRRCKCFNSIGLCLLGNRSILLVPVYRVVSESPLWIALRMDDSDRLPIAAITEYFATSLWVSSERLPTIAAILGVFVHDSSTIQTCFGDWK